ncbi:MAG TPA: cytochrome c [Steroidobacter sp.]|nr:cytochrome c [Steroidobacter sp.]
MAFGRAPTVRIVDSDCVRLLIASGICSGSLPRASCFIPTRDFCEVETMAARFAHRSGFGRTPVVATLAIIGFCVQADEAPDMSGSELYRIFCATCHGAQGRGDGPVAETLKTTVPDLTRIAARRGGAFPAERVRETIDGQNLPRAHGAREMPVWGWDFYAINRPDPARRERTNELIGRLVDYLASIQEE